MLSATCDYVEVTQQLTSKYSRHIRAPDISGPEAGGSSECALPSSCLYRCPAGPVGTFSCACCVPCWTKVAARGPPAPSTDTHRCCKSKLESHSLHLEGTGALSLSVEQCLAKSRTAPFCRECTRTVTGQQAAQGEVIGLLSGQPIDSPTRQ